MIVYVVLGILVLFAVVTLANLEPALLAPSGYPPLARHRLQRRADLLRLPRLRHHHLHRERPRRPVPTAPPRDVPRARASRPSSTSPSPSGCSAPCTVRGGHRLRRHRPRGGRRAHPRSGRLLADERHRAVRHRRRHQRRALPGRRALRATRRERQFPTVLGRRLRRARARSGSWSRRPCLVLAIGFDLDAIASIGSAVALLVFTLVTVAHSGSGPRPARGPLSWCWRSLHLGSPRDLHLHDAHP